MYCFKLIDLKDNYINVKTYIGEERYSFYQSKKTDKILILFDAGEAIADVGIYLTDTESKESLKTGYIGLVHSLKEELFEEDFSMIISLAEKCLIKNKCANIIAPLDRDTWSEYRCKVYTELDNPFIGEPGENNYEIYQKLGYKQKFKYLSTINSNQFIEEKEFSNVTFRFITEETLMKDIKSIHKLSTEEFKNNLFYGDISEELFVKQYLGLYTLLKPIICVAEHNNEIVGFLMGYSGELCVSNEKSFVMKTLAVKREFRSQGLGFELYKRVANKTFKNGFNKLIGALIYEENNSYKITKKYKGDIVSRYVLFEKKIKEKK